LNNFQGKVVVCMGDFRQIAPIINNGDRHDIVIASIKTSNLWTQFTILHLTVNMRLAQTNNNDDRQKEYADLILAIGEGFHLNKDADMQSWDGNTGEQTYALSNVPYILSEVSAIEYIYPNKTITPEESIHQVLLAICNKDVDTWNSRIQQLNTNTAVSLISKYSLCEVDDPHGLLKQMLSEDILHQFNNNSCPPHELILMRGDVCITRNIAIQEELTNNARVMITDIQQHCISVHFDIKFIL